MTSRKEVIKVLAFDLRVKRNGSGVG